MKVADILKPRIKIGQGDRFLVTWNSGQKEEFILAQVDVRKLSLISLKDGNRWARAVEVSNTTDITLEEWMPISLEENGGFTWELLRSREA